jgi:hypothetical protein
VPVVATATYREVMANPYQGQDGYDRAWQDGYDYGQAHPSESDPAPPAVFAPLDLDGEILGYMQQVWREGALAGRETPVLAMAGGGAAAAPAAAAHQPQESWETQQSWESRERGREIDRGTREHTPGDMGAWFQSDWAGRAILARYLAGDGDWVIENDEAWTQYMCANPSLRYKLAQHATYLIANVAALGYDEGVIDVNEQFHVDIENGEGIVGYQYLHGTNESVGGFQIVGWGRMVPAHDSPDATESSARKRVHFYLEYTWNDMIDPNPQYGTDEFKAGIGYAISMGGAASYRLSITWHGEGIVTVGENGEILEVSTTSDSGEALNGYPVH